MKQLIAVMIAFVIAISGAADTSAEKAADPMVKNMKMENHYRHLKNFQENIHKANNLKIKRLEIKKEIVQKKDKLFELHMLTAESGDKSKRTEVHKSRRDLKQINSDLRKLCVEARDMKTSMHEAMRGKNEKLAKEKMTHWLSLQEKINSKLSEKSAQLDKVISSYK
jgi:hypothetical protein